MKKVFYLFIVPLVFLCFSRVEAVDVEVLKRVKIISTNELKKLYDEKTDLLLINTLSPIEFAEERIRDSVNLPYMHIKTGKAKLPEDKNRMLVFYCKGPSWTKSIKTALLAVTMGYKNVHEYNEGLPEWKKRGFPLTTVSLYPSPKIAAISGSDLKRMMEAKDDIFIVDLRDEEDRKIGFIKGSVHIDLEILDDNIAKLPRDKKIVLVDFHGKQSYIAARFLAKNGFQNIVMLDKGVYEGWLKAGLPLTK